MMHVLFVSLTANAVELAPERLVRDYLSEHEGVTWKRAQRDPISLEFGWLWLRFSTIKWSTMTSSASAPPELGIHRDAVMRCGLRDESVFSAVVSANDNRVGPWNVEILDAPSEAIGDCIARILEVTPWDREYPAGSTVALALRTTGAAIRSWSPPDPHPSTCTLNMSGVGAIPVGTSHWTMPMDHKVGALSCASDEPLTHLEIEITDGIVASVRTAPQVPCVEALVGPMVPEITAMFQRPNIDTRGASIRCDLVVPLDSP